MSLEAFRTLLSHPAPGLVFGAHQFAGVGERAYATPHHAAPPPSRPGMQLLESLTAKHRDALSDVVEVYSAHDGLGFCELYDRDMDRTVPALRLLPISGWEEATEEWRSGDCSRFMEDVAMYHAGQWRVIGQMPCEGLSLVVFFGGDYEGKPLAGRMFCLGLDGYLGYEEELAPSLDAFARSFAADPAAVFKRIGFGWGVETERGNFGDPIQSYVADVRGHPSLTRWR